ncbi:hypothetical protein K3495_g2841 [Podosphaera aphanis]|nr:hypothetical protein K3495_g2841 [Podosphaera aphanis]
MVVNNHTDPFEDPIVENNTSAMRGGRGECGATMAAKDANTNTGIALVKFNQILRGQDLPSRGYKMIIKEAIQIIEELRNAKANPLLSPKNNRKDENITTAKILQEIQSLKSTISQSQSRPRGQA